jgi:hypothetical protein
MRLIEGGRLGTHPSKVNGEVAADAPSLNQHRNSSALTGGLLSDSA